MDHPQSPADPVPVETARHMAPGRLLEAAAAIRAHATPAAAEIRQAYFSDYPRVARAQLAEPLGAYAALMHPALGEALAVLLEVEARVDAEDCAALRAEGRVPEEEHRSCTVASCTTLAALAVADALLVGVEQ